MTKYINSFTGSETTLLSNAEKQKTGRLTKINICNNAGTSETISVFLNRNTDNQKTYIIRGMVMPAYSTLVLEDCLSFDIESHSLRMAHDTSIDFSVILK